MTTTGEHLSDEDRAAIWDAIAAAAGGDHATLPTSLLRTVIEAYDDISQDLAMWRHRARKRVTAAYNQDLYAAIDRGRDFVARRDEKIAELRHELEQLGR